MGKLKNDKEHQPIKIHRGRIKSIIVFEILENELDIIENGEKHKPLERWGTNLLSISLTLFLAWLTGDFANEFLDLMILLGWFSGTIVGAILLQISKQYKKSVKTTIEMIRRRHSLE